MPIKLYDLVAQKPGGRFFSPFCIVARCALLAKGIDFETVEVTYSDLRFHWSPKLGVQRATAPIIELEDGTCIMDSVEIAKYFDKTYPDRTNLFLPEAPLPVDVTSKEYQDAVESYPAIQKLPEFKDIRMDVFALYAPRITKTFDEETAEYWKSKERLAESVERLKQFLKVVSSRLFTEDRQFLASSTKPGMEDFCLLGQYRLFRSTSATIAAQIFESPEAGEFQNWLKRMKEHFPLEEQVARDPKE
ncbi:hypothetical protein JCM10207_000953 [Rhodosporidiobolus poonsookiae]